MTKKNLIEKVALELSIDYEEAKIYVNAILGEITKALAKGERVQLIGFGTFEVRTHHGREFINPSTGQTHIVYDSKLPYFKVGEVLKREVKKAGNEQK